ncbi:hypothetical protein Ciccas_012757, partial [Cichlidogyrus casuarinus]
MLFWILVLNLGFARGHPGIQNFTLNATVQNLVQGQPSYPEFQIYFRLAPTFQAAYVKPTIHHGNLFYPVDIAEYE